MSDLKQFEDQLKALSAREPEAGLKDRIRQDLAADEPGWRRFTVPLGLFFAAAAVLFLSFLLLAGPEIEETPATSRNPDEAPIGTAASPTGQTSGEQEGSFKPVDIENNLKNTIDEGIVFLQNGVSARQYRYQFIDRVVWENSRGARMEMEIPRDEVVLVPVQTF